MLYYSTTYSSREHRSVHPLRPTVDGPWYSSDCIVSRGYIQQYKFLFVICELVGPPTGVCAWLCEGGEIISGCNTRDCSLRPRNTWWRARRRQACFAPRLCVFDRGETFKTPTEEEVEAAEVCSSFAGVRILVMVDFDPSTTHGWCCAAKWV